MPGQPELTARRLLRWGDLDERRRRRAGIVGRLAWIGRIGLGAGLAALVARNAKTDPVAASRLVLAALIVFYTFVMFGAPFRMFWRVDSPLLARLPIPGRALFDVALVRSLRAAGAAAIVVVPAACALALVPEVGRELALRHLALWGAVALAAALLLPAVALAAGAIVASGKAQNLIAAAAGAGDVGPPPSAWLGVLPGFASSGIVLAVIGSGAWARGAAETVVGPAAPLLGVIAGGSIVAVLAARAAAASVMPLAVREVAALDVQRLAHIEIHRPTAIERAVERLLSPRAALVHGKDARLLRRRFPMAFVIGAVTTLALWILAAVQSDAAWSWIAMILGGFAAYGGLMARRLVTAPIELPYLATLPIEPAAAKRAKAAYLATWLVVYPAVGGLGFAVAALF